MSNAIRVISRKNNTDTVQVYRHEVIVRREHGGFTCECREHTLIGYIECKWSDSLCWHVRSAVAHLAWEKEQEVEWFEDEDESRFAWGTTLYSHRYTVRSKGAMGYVVTREKAQIAG